MLSENQQEVVKNRVNADIDLPWVGEDREGRLIEKVIEKVNPILEPSLRAILPGCYVDCIQIALKEDIPVEARRKKISDILRGEIAEPLAQQLNSNIDSAFIPDRLEEKLMQVVANKIVDEMVEWTVGEIDQRMSSSLAQSRDALQS